MTFPEAIWVIHEASFTVSDENSTHVTDLNPDEMKTVFVDHYLTQSENPNNDDGIRDSNNDIAVIMSCIPPKDVFYIPTPTETNETMVCFHCQTKCFLLFIFMIYSLFQSLMKVNYQIDMLN